jgi:hypothetical protein
MKRLTVMGIALLVSTACDSDRTPGDGTAVTEKVNERFADTLVDDLSWLSTAAEEIAQGAEDVPDDSRRATNEACYDTYGDCDFCYNLTGGPLTGTFLAGPSDTPCGWSSGLVALDYTVDDSVLQGSYGGSIAGDYNISATGSRTATVSAGEQDFDASFTLDSLQVSTTLTELDSFDADLTYDGFGDITWVVHVEGTADSVVGSATGGDYGCTIAASLGDAAVSCEEMGDD